MKWQRLFRFILSSKFVENNLSRQLSSSRKITIRGARCQNICSAHPSWVCWYELELKQQQKKNPEKCQMRVSNFLFFRHWEPAGLGPKKICWSFCGEGLKNNQNLPTTSVLCTVIKICELINLYSICFFLLMPLLVSSNHDYDFYLFLFFLIGIHSMQGWTAATRHGVTRKRSTEKIIAYRKSV